MHIREGKFVVCFHVLHNRNNTLDLHVGGVNGYFDEPETLSHFLKNTDEYDMNPIIKAIREKYGVSDSEEFYNVYVELDFIPAEYGDYGQKYTESYYTISVVIEVEKVVFELEGSDTTEQHSEAEAV